MYPMPYNVKKNDLKFYANCTDPMGPAMTHSMFTIGWLDIGQPENAYKAFEKNLISHENKHCSHINRNDIFRIAHCGKGTVYRRSSRCLL